MNLTNLVAQVDSGTSLLVAVVAVAVAAIVIFVFWWLRRPKICPQCHIRPIIGGTSTCSECAQQVICPQCHVRPVIAGTDRCGECAQPSMCVQCGIRPSDPGSTICVECARPKRLCLRCKINVPEPGFDQCSECRKTKFCMHHGEPVPREARECPRTGEKYPDIVPDVKACVNRHNCPAYIPISAKYCEVCGELQALDARTGGFKPIQVGPNMSCSVCQAQIATDQQAFQCSICQAVYHDGCLETWKQFNHTCKGCSDRLRPQQRA